MIVKATTRSIKMLRFAFLLASSVVVVVTAKLPMHRRQEVTYTYVVASEESTPVTVTATLPQHRDNVEKMCLLNFWTWTRGTPAEQKAAGVDGIRSFEEFWLSDIIKKSPFPCEAQEYLDWACITRDYSEEGQYGTAPKEVIEAERACFCPSKAFELWQACSLCFQAHGYQSEKTTQEEIRFQDLVAQKFCNETVPEVNLYWVERGLWEERPADDNATYPDKFPGKTEVNLYYTSGVRPQTTGTFIPGSETTGTTDPETSALEPFTRASTFGVTSTVGLPDATSIGAAGELKAAGGVVVAMLGAMVML